MIMITTTTAAAIRVKLVPAAVLVALVTEVDVATVGPDDVVVIVVGGGMLLDVVTVAVFEVPVFVAVPVAEVVVIVVLVVADPVPPRLRPQNCKAT